jgi:hypothetical protein
LLGTARGHHNRRAQRRKLFSHGPANAAATAGYNCHLSLEFLSRHVQSLPKARHPLQNSRAILQKISTRKSQARACGPGL